MRIGFDAKRAFYNNTGLGNYSRNLIKALSQYHPENEYLLFTPGASDMTFKPPHTRIVQPDSGWTFTWRSYGIIRQLMQEKVDVFHGLSNEIPFTLKGSHVKSVVTIHDVIFRHYPDAYAAIDRTIYNYKTRHAVKYADVIVASSEATAKDLATFYGVSIERIRVIYPLLQDIFYEEVPVEKPTASLPEAYILFAGTGNERKNLELAIHLIDALPEDDRIPFVVTGGKGRYAEKMRSLINRKNLNKYFLFIDNCSDVQMKYLYENATLLFYPSFYEGFGMPVAEALLCNCPVIASSTSSIPEAGGAAALYCAPDNLDAALEAYAVITQDTSWKAGFIQRARAAVKRFDRKLLAEEWNTLYATL